MNRLIVSAAVAGLWVSLPLAADPPAAPPPPAKDGVLDGPKVPPEGVTGDRPFGGGEGRGQRPGQRGAGGMLPGMGGEIRALNAALADLKDLSPDTKSAIDREIKTFTDAMRSWETAHGDKLKALQSKGEAMRRSAQESGMPPDRDAMDALRKEREALMETAPKPKATLDKVLGMLTPEQATSVRERMRAAGRGARGPRDGTGAGPGSGADGMDGMPPPPRGRPGRGGRGPGGPGGPPPTDPS